MHKGDFYREAMGTTQLDISVGLSVQHLQEFTEL
jgi:hypothetical protein